LGPVASTLTTSPPRSTLASIKILKSEIYWITEYGTWQKGKVVPVHAMIA
jgi:hypothetical protein